jgi:4-hydroxybenzoate polyprenyltransferase
VAKNIGLKTSAVIFGIVALVHVVRLFTGFTVVIGTWGVPLWVSGVAAVVAGALAVWLFRLSRP